jgi:hypothetical protein
MLESWQIMPWGQAMTSLCQHEKRSKLERVWSADRLQSDLMNFIAASSGMDGKRVSREIVSASCNYTQRRTQQSPKHLRSTKQHKKRWNNLLFLQFLCVAQMELWDSQVFLAETTGKVASLMLMS